MDSFNKIMANAVKKKLLGEHPCGGGSQHEWDLVAQKMINATGYPFSANVVFTRWVKRSAIKGLISSRSDHVIVQYLYVVNKPGPTGVYSSGGGSHIRIAQADQIVLFKELEREIRSRVDAPSQVKRRHSIQQCCHHNRQRKGESRTASCRVSVSERLLVCGLSQTASVVPTVDEKTRRPSSRLQARVSQRVCAVRLLMAKHQCTRVRSSLCRVQHCTE